MIGHIKAVKDIHFSGPTVKGASMKALVSKNEGWEGYVMRVVTVEPHGYTPKHSHPWPHINYMLEGQGELMIDGVSYPVEEGSYAYVPGDHMHQFSNTGKSPFRFICIVPEEGHKY